MVGMMTTAILGSLSLLFWTGGSTWLGGGLGVAAAYRGWVLVRQIRG